MKIFTAEQVRQIDAYTIANEPVRSIDLMERAAVALYNWFNSFVDRGTRIIIIAGAGNNGGDGYALARLLRGNGFSPMMVDASFGSKRSADCQVNYDRLLERGDVGITALNDQDDLPHIDHRDLVVDAIFGTGLARPVAGVIASVIRKINESGAKIVSVDVPSGLFSENNDGNDMAAIVRANDTLTFQFPKLAFLLPENEDFTGRFHLLPIGLHEKIICELETDKFMIQKSMVSSILRRRKRFDHKGNFGHGLMAAGSCGKAGAAVLSVHAALRTGIGLITAHVPKPVGDVIHASVPEAMVQCDQSDVIISELCNLGKFDAVGFGPGVGTTPNTAKALRKVIETCKLPLVIDADGLNILSMEKELVDKLPRETILTPHPGEFERLTGTGGGGYARLTEQVNLSKRSGAIVVLKGAYTSISLPDGRIWFNTTGNPGMATAGSGDVLTGMILSMLAQGYSPSNAAIAAVYLHGLAGDIAAEEMGQEAMIASDIIRNIGKAFKSMEQ